MYNQADIVNELKEIFFKYLNLTYVEDINDIDTNNWSVSSISVTKSLNFDNFDISIVAKFATMSDYLDLVTKQFYNVIDTKFADRQDDFSQADGYNLRLTYKVVMK